MTLEQVIVFGTLFLALIFFAAGRWRYDVVALMALLVVAASGIVEANAVFSGFGHPAVMTVAAVLVVSRGLQNSGVVDAVAQGMSHIGDRPAAQIIVLTGLVTVFSGFMNNIGALALFMPVAIRIARRGNYSPSLLLMPLAFGSLLGGLTTLIGTPPNIIIATFREQNSAVPFRMFDFTPVGIGVAFVGVLFVSLIGWRLIPQRKGQISREDLFEIEDYITEVRVPHESQIAGRPLRDLTEVVSEVEITVVGLVRGEQRLMAPSSFEIMRAGDILIVEADSDSLKALVDAAGFELVGSKEFSKDILGSDEVSVMEAIVMANSPMEGRTALNLNLRWRYGVNLLAVARQGARLRSRLESIHFRVGDVLLLQGRTETLQEVLSTLRCLPLAERGLRFGRPRRVLLSTGVFGVAVLITALGLLPVQITFVGAAVIMVLFGLLSLGEAYDSINWPIIVLLGAMIPIGQALENTGGAQLIASGLLEVAGQMSPVGMLVIVLVGTMFLSDVVNNAAAAVLMAPIAANVAQGIGASVDPFLMAVAIGASCAFLTPIGHQSNTLVMGPGGYRFGDYWRMGLPLEIIITLVATPLILWFWPLAVAVP